MTVTSLEDVEAEDLDELVHDLASEIAAGINNDGKDAQLEYLRSTGHMTDAQIIEALNKGFEDTGYDDENIELTDNDEELTGDEDDQDGNG